MKKKASLDAESASSDFGNFGDVGAYSADTFSFGTDEAVSTSEFGFDDFSDTPSIPEEKPAPEPAAPPASKQPAAPKSSVQAAPPAPAAKTPAASGSPWKCLSCETENDADALSCDLCSVSKPTAKDLQKHQELSSAASDFGGDFGVTAADSGFGDFNNDGDFGFSAPSADAGQVEYDFGNFGDEPEEKAPPPKSSGGKPKPSAAAASKPSLLPATPAKPSRPAARVEEDAFGGQLESDFGVDSNPFEDLDPEPPKMRSTRSSAPSKPTSSSSWDDGDDDNPFGNSVGSSSSKSDFGRDDDPFGSGTGSSDPFGSDMGGNNDPFGSGSGDYDDGPSSAGDPFYSNSASSSSSSSNRSRNQQRGSRQSSSNDLDDPFGSGNNDVGFDADPFSGSSDSYNNYKNDSDDPFGSSSSSSRSSSSSSRGYMDNPFEQDVPKTPSSNNNRRVRKPIRGRRTLSSNQSSMPESSDPWS